MNNFPKEPNIKLIPSDPMTNTILIIYCVSSTGASVPYKASWRRVNPKLHKVQDIKHHTGSSYRCSPLDIDYVIEATVYFQHQNVQMSRIVQSNVVKVSRQLKEKRMLLKEPVVARLITPQMQLEMKITVHESMFTIAINHPNYQSPSLNLPINQLNFETQANQLNFKMTFKHRVDDFLNFLASFTGTKPRLKNNEVFWNCPTDLSRDLILLGISEAVSKSNKYDHQTNRFPVTARHMTEKNGKITSRDMDKSRSPNRSQTSVSPKPYNKDRMQMKKSFTKPIELDKKHDHSFTSTISQSKQEPKNKKQERQCLNVFEDDELELLNAPINPSPPLNPPSHNKVSRPKTPVAGFEDEAHNDGPSINLRGSFEQLEKSFNSNLNEQAIDKIFGVQSNDANKKMQEELNRLKNQNESLKKQVESIAFLTKENNSIKRKYLQMKEEVNRLQMERKVILTDKLRCEVNWHKEIQQKESLKKQVQQLRQMVKSSNISPTGYMERSKAGSYYEPAGHDRSDTMNRSHNAGYHH